MKSAEPKLIRGGAVFPEASLSPIEAVFRKAIERGAPRPEAVVIEDDKGSWRTLLLRLAPGERQGSVLVYQSAEALDFAGRLSIGGAMSFPPSTLKAESACRAAARNRYFFPVDPLVLGEVRNLGWSPIRLQPDSVWRRILGFRAMLGLLADLAAGLGCQPMIDSEPALYLPAEMVNDLGGAWTDLKERPAWARAEMISGGDRPSPEEQDWGEFSGTLGRLPQGDLPGRWFLDSEGGRLHWRLEGLEATVIDGRDPEDPKAAEAELIRLPSWLHLDLAHQGSPGNELLSVWGAAMGRGELWIPNLRKDGIDAVLGLGRSVFIDGPVLPRSPLSRPGGVAESLA